MPAPTTPADVSDRSLSIREAAEREGVSTKTIRRRIADGSLPAHRVGPRLLRVRVADLDALRRQVPTGGTR